MGKRFLPLFIFIMVATLLAGGKTFLFIGDSITDGNWGSPQGYPCSSVQRNHWDKNHVLGHGYVEMIAGTMGGEYPDSNYNFINRGISGETLSQISSRWDNDVISYNPNVISLLCGTNDIHYWMQNSPKSVEEFDFEGYRTTLDSLLSYTQQQLPNIRIVICTPFVAKVGEIGKADNYNLRLQAIDSLSSLIRNIVEERKTEKIELVDFNSLTNKLSSENPNMEYWIWDGIHPTTPMHYRMAKEWIQKSRQLIYL